jgi:hypothetical protein
MKKSAFLLLFAGLFTITSCDRVAPNYYGVLMENYGKNGITDYTLQQGRVSTMSPGTELFQVPAWEQRAAFTDDKGNSNVLHLKAADNSEFTANPKYSYKVQKEKAAQVVFENSRLGSSESFMRSIEDNVLEPKIYDMIKEESRKYMTDTLMATGGSLAFEQRVQTILKDVFSKNGLELLSFSSNLDFSDKVKEKIDTRNEVNTNISTIDSKILEQRKTNELAKLIAEEQRIKASAITKELLTQQFIEKWDGHTPLYGTMPTFFLQK